MTTRSMSRQFAVPMSAFTSDISGAANTAQQRIDEGDNRTGTLIAQEDIRPASADAAIACYHSYQDSIPNSLSNSSDSSPTTTLSTMDSLSATDPSPNSSPESPESKSSRYHFSATAREKLVPSSTFLDSGIHPNAVRRPRNLKNLAVNTSPGPSLGRAVSTASLPIAADATDSPTLLVPASASFVRPPPPSRRKLSNLGLTIKTPVTHGLHILTTRPPVPPTPSIKRPTTLRHFQSSPSLSIQSPIIGPPGSSELGSLRSLADVPAETDEIEEEQNFDVPQSREEKPEAYPNGPVCIYDDHVYLYLEPTVEQASNYDVILNVASEVQDPFSMVAADAESSDDNLIKPVLSKAASVSEPSALLPDSPEGLRRMLPVRSTGLKSSEAGKPPPEEPTSPSTSSGLQHTKPEYIHIPWEHNTDIVPDLYKLVKLIDDRVSQQKRVLIHCQCGVSRSASLVVAYGLYKNPNMSVQAAFDVVKKRSKWIDPNMNLIMQLQEFRDELLRGTMGSSDRQRSNGFVRRFPHSATSTPTGTSSVDRYLPYRARNHNPSSTPLSAPLPPDFSAPAQRASTGCLDTIAPGPSSAPLIYPWLPDQRNSWAPGQGSADFSIPSLSAKPTLVDTTGRIHAPSDNPLSHMANHLLSLPDVVGGSSPSFLSTPNACSAHKQSYVSADAPQPADTAAEATSATGPTPLEPLVSPRAAEFAMTPLTQVSTDDAFGLTSPRAAKFNLYPADRASQDALSGFQTKAKEAYMQRQIPHPQLYQSLDPGLQQPANRSRNFSRPRGLTLQQPVTRAMPQPSPVPPLSSPDSENTYNDMMSPRLAEFTSNPLHMHLPISAFGLNSHQGPVRGVNGTGIETVASDGLMSPRATEFTGSPFRKLSTPSTVRTSETSKPLVMDPRSPPQKGGVPIVRNIFGVLEARESLEEDIGAQMERCSHGDIRDDLDDWSV